MTLPSASLLVLKAWVVIGLALIGIGLLFRRLWSAAATSVEELIQSFWLGWALLLVLLQLWHFFLPVDQRAAAAAVALGAIGIAVGGWRSWVALLRGIPRHLPTLAFFALLALGLSNRALDGPHFGDVGLYHLPVVYWDEAYPIVPGLGNLYVPFGHNISYFLWVAVLDVGPVAHRALHLSNSILVLALFARGLLGLDRLSRTWRPCAPQDAYWALVLPIALGQAFSLFFTSPSPDQPLSLLGLVLGGELVAFFARQAPRRAPDFDLLAITLLVTAAITVKLSIAGLAGAVLLLAILRWLFHDRPLRSGGWSTLIAMTEVAVAGATIWITGNLVLSGCPLYPSAVAALPVDWRVQADAVQWIEKPMVWGGPLWRLVLDWRWFLRRLDSLGWIRPLLVAAARGCAHCNGRGIPAATRPAPAGRAATPAGHSLPGRGVVRLLLCLCADATLPSGNPLDLAGRQPGAAHGHGGVWQRAVGPRVHCARGGCGRRRGIVGAASSPAPAAYLCGHAVPASRGRAPAKRAGSARATRHADLLECTVAVHPGAATGPAPAASGRPGVGVRDRSARSGGVREKDYRGLRGLSGFHGFGWGSQMLRMLIEIRAIRSIRARRGKFRRELGSPGNYATACAEEAPSCGASRRAHSCRKDSRRMCRCSGGINSCAPAPRARRTTSSPSRCPLAPR